MICLEHTFDRNVSTWSAILYNHRFIQLSLLIPGQLVRKKNTKNYEIWELCDLITVVNCSSQKLLQSKSKDIWIFPPFTQLHLNNMENSKMNFQSQKRKNSSQNDPSESNALANRELGVLILGIRRDDCTYLILYLIH